MELRTYLDLIQQLELSPAIKTGELLEQSDRLIGLLIGLIRSLVGRA